MQNTTNLISVTQLCKLFVALPVMLVVLLAWTATDELVNQLRVDYAAFRSAEDDFRLQRELNGLAGADAADYAAYVAGLQRRVFEDCQAVLRSGAPFPDDLPCPVIVPPVTVSADISTQAEQTPEEQIAAMDEKFNAGLGEYDERLLREQERIKAAAPNNNPDGDGTGFGDNASSGDGASSGDSPGDATSNAEDSSQDGEAENENENTGSQPPGGPGTSNPGTSTAGKDSDQPADIPDGSDDDIVARQLREAAEKETDPELKAKLWEEYRRYKQGTQ